MALPLRKPNTGITGWGGDVNQNFTDIEELFSNLQMIPEIGMAGPIHMNAELIDGIDDLVITGTPTQLYVTLDGRYYTQEQIHELLAGASFNFWLSDTADGVIGGYNKMFDAGTEEVKSSIGPIVIDADEKLIQPFITEIAHPDFTVLSEGVYALDIHAITTVGANIKAARLRWKLYSRTQPGGVETLLITSEDGPILTAVEIHYQVHGILAAETVLDATDRLVLKVYGLREGAEPQNPSVTIYQEGDTSSRIEVRTTISAFDSRYLLLDGQNSPAADIDWGGFQITNVGNVDGVDVSALKTDVDGFPDQLKQLLTAEIQQLENIGATTISAGQWGYLGSLVNLLNLTEAEAGQLLKINGTNIGTTQWDYLGDVEGGIMITGTFTRDLTVASGAQVIAGVGFQPSSVEFIAVFSANSFSVGFDDGTTAGSGQNLLTVGPRFDLNESIVTQMSGGGTASVAHISAFGADGFTLSWTRKQVRAGTARMIYKAYR